MSIFDRKRLGSSARSSDAPDDGDGASASRSSGVQQPPDDLSRRQHTGTVPILGSGIAIPPPRPKTDSASGEKLIEPLRRPPPRKPPPPRAASAPPEEVVPVEVDDVAEAPPPDTDRPTPAMPPPQPVDSDASLPGSVAASLDWDDAADLRAGDLPAGGLGVGDLPAAGADVGDERSREDDPYIGTTIGERYVVDCIIGEGGMGRVYLAHHKVIGKKVAIKILHAELAKDKESVGRFVREAQAASSIGNEHIIDISDFGELPDGSTYFVMEYLDGESLGDLIEQRGALPPELIYDLGRQLCAGLHAAHRQQIIHRDLKPDNITLVTQAGRKNFVKILDFGIAKVSGPASGNTKLTMAGAVFGTPHYMSPEQAAGTSVDHRTDIYSLGVMLYEMASGEMPFNADNFMGILTQHMYKAPVPIRALVSAPDCPPGLEAIILKCLSKKPDARYQTMEDLGADLAKLQTTGISDAVQEMMARSGSFNVPADYFKAGAQAVVPATPTGRPARRIGPTLAAVAGVAVAVIVVLAVLLRGMTTGAESASTERPDPKGGTAAPTATAAPGESAVAKAADQMPKTVPVLVWAVPSEATAELDGKTIKLPETFDVPRDGELAITVSAGDNYQPREVKLDGKEPKVKVVLERKAQKAGPARPRPRPGPRPGPKPPSGSKPKPKPGGEVVDPWGR